MKVTLDLDDETYHELKEEHEFNNEGYRHHNNENPDKTFKDFLVHILKDWGKFDGMTEDTKERLEEVKEELNKRIDNTINGLNYNDQIKT